MIPKIIHQVYWDSNDAFRLPPNLMLRNRSKLIDLHPSFEYKCWNKQQCLRVVEQYDKDFGLLYAQLPDAIQFVCAKWLILYTVGGVFYSMEVEPTYSIESITSDPNCDIFMFANGKKVNDLCFGATRHHAGVENIIAFMRSNPCDFVPEIRYVADDACVLPVGGIDHQRRTLVKHVAKYYMKEHVLIFPDEWVRGTYTFSHEEKSIKSMFGMYKPINIRASRITTAPVAQLHPTRVF